MPNPYDEADAAYRARWISGEKMGRPLWVPGVVTKKLPDTLTVTTLLAPTVSVTDKPTQFLLMDPAQRWRHASLPPPSPSHTGADPRICCPQPPHSVPDLNNLTHLHEASLLQATVHRFLDEEIYTAAGPVLIAVNPYRTIVQHQHTRRL